MRRSIPAVAAAMALAAPAAAGAHVTVQPDTAEAGGYARLDVRVPNERDDAGTVKVDVQLPPGVASASYEPVPGWRVKVTREKIDEPLEVHGEEVTEQVSRVTWTGNPRRGGIVEPGQFQDFGLSLRVPDGEAGEKLTFKALQTYESGEVVRWIGPEDADNPAAVVTLTAAEEHAAAPAATPEGEPQPAAAPTGTAARTASRSRRWWSARSGSAPGWRPSPRRGARARRADAWRPGKVRPGVDSPRPGSGNPVERRS